MIISNPFNKPTITVDVFNTMHGAPLAVPLALVEVDDLPASHRLDPLQAFHIDVDQRATPGQPDTFTGPWRACTPGVPILVEAAAACPLVTLYLQSSEDGITAADTVSPGNFSDDFSGVRFTTSCPFYRLSAAPSETVHVLVRSQQRAA